MNRKRTVSSEPSNWPIQANGRLEWASIVLFLLLAASCWAKDDSVLLSCSDSRKVEVAQMRRAPHGAVRTGKHVLRVNTAAGFKVFRDRPPFDAPLDGTSWTYCGYSPDVRMHLIRKIDGGLFTGVLLDEISNSVLPAGEWVLFSPDFKKYLAVEQPDGQDGETLMLYTRTGKLIGVGTNGILTADGTGILVFSEDIHNIRWSGDSLIAEVRTKGRKPYTVVFADHEGRWQWQTRR